MPSIRSAWVAGAAVAALLACAGPASAQVTVRTYTDGPYTIKGYQVKQDLSFNLPKPREDGFITAMDVDVVDRDTGKPVPINRIMLHHIVFVALGQPDVQGNVVPDAFYGEGEERDKMQLPPGFGYRVRGDSSWAIVWMLMNHRAKTDSVLIRYHLTYDTNPNLTPVRPIVFDASHGRQGLVYDVAGGAKRGATDTRVAWAKMPFSGRLVAGLGHVHGGAKNLTVSQPDCGDRKVYVSRPTWGKATHPFYHVRPILHEPGPINMSRFSSTQGVPVTKGEPLKMSSNYDAQYAHTRVMGLLLVYLAPDPNVTRCGPVGKRTIYRTSTPGRRKPPRFFVPLTGLDSTGRAITIKHPPGPLVRSSGDANINVRDFSFSEPNISVPRGATVQWNFNGSIDHDVTVANAPVGFSSDNLTGGASFRQKLIKPGTYRFFCALHPVQMTQRIVVRK